MHNLVLVQTYEPFRLLLKRNKIIFLKMFANHVKHNLLYSTHESFSSVVLKFSINANIIPFSICSSKLCINCEKICSFSRRGGYCPSANLIHNLLWVDEIADFFLNALCTAEAICIVPCLKSSFD